MQGTAAIAHREPSPADVIAFLRADYTLRCGVDPEVDAGFELQASTTIADWRETCDLVRPALLVPALNGWFDMSATSAEWRSILEPQHERTLGDLAAFVAARASWPHWQSVRVAGVEDSAVGAFFSLKGLLARAGVPTRGLRPATVVADFARSHLLELGTVLAKLAPYLVTEPRLFWSPASRALRVAAMVSFVGAVAFGIFGSPVLSVSLATFTVVGFVISDRSKPRRVELGAYRTFADLARAIAGRGRGGLTRS